MHGARLHASQTCGYSVGSRLMPPCVAPACAARGMTRLRCPSRLESCTVSGRGTRLRMPRLLYNKIAAAPAAAVRAPTTSTLLRDTCIVPAVCLQTLAGAEKLCYTDTCWHDSTLSLFTREKKHKVHWVVWESKTGEACVFLHRLTMSQ